MDSRGAGQAGQATSPRLIHAAHEFEAQMMKELLKPMTGQDNLTGETDEGGDAGASGALGEFASETLGQALSQAGGFGIANRIIQQLSHSGKSAESGKQSGTLRQDNQNKIHSMTTVIRKAADIPPKE